METGNLTVRDKTFIQEAMKVMDEHLAERKFGVAEFCNVLGKNRITVHRRLKLILGKTASQFIRELRLDHAAQLLSEGKVNVHKAAIESGFYNHSYFSKCFKARFGYLPSEYHERRA